MNNVHGVIAARRGQHQLSLRSVHASSTAPFVAAIWTHAKDVAVASHTSEPLATLAAASSGRGR
jgi:hypothetical protein